MGDFNIDLLKYESNIDSSTFLGKIYSRLLLPYISSPSQLTSWSQTLIDNIFSNNIEGDIINSGNLTSTISDYYAQFIIFENTHTPPPPKKKKKDPATEKLQCSLKTMNKKKLNLK